MVNKKRFFKNIAPWKYGGKTKTRNIIMDHRLNVYEQVCNQDYGAGLRNITEEEKVLNCMSLGALVQRIWFKFGSDDMETVGWVVPDLRVDIKNQDPLLTLIGHTKYRCDIRSINDMDLILAEYDFSLQSPFFYFNTKGKGPWRVKYIKDMCIVYRGYTEWELEQCLKRLSKDLGEYFSFTEPYIVGATQVFSLKEEVVRRFIKSSIYNFEQREKSIPYIVEDAYVDIVRLSSIYQDFSFEERYTFLDNIRESFRDNIYNSLKRGRYIPYITNREMLDYNLLFKKYLIGFNKMSQYLIHPTGNIPYDIAEYYIFDQNLGDCNKLKVNMGHIDNFIMEKLVYNKVIRSIISQVHPDVRVGLYLLYIHLDLSGLLYLYKGGSALTMLISKIISKEFRLKPILIKYLFKSVCDDYLHDMKENGLITCHQIENFFGYRMGVTIIDEVKKDYMTWFNKDTEQFSDRQYQFIKKWAPEYFKKYNYKGIIVGDIVRNNLSHYKDFNELLGDYSQYLTGHGTIADVRVKDTDGKNRSISKNLFFQLYQNPSDFLKNELNHDLNRNKVVIKREELIKQRIVINSTLNTFRPLSKINKFLSVAFSGTGDTYLFNTKDQKAEHYVRLENYLLYNKCNEQRYLCLPLDYSSYDHTITLGFIHGVIESMSEFTGFSELNQLYEEFINSLREEIIYFKELGDNDKDNNQKYKYGMLSGWKITSSVESIGNAIFSYGIMRELGLELVDLETMGDDLIIILDYLNLSRGKQLELLKVICEKYQSYGFEMNPNKNSIGYWFLEFLRVCFRPCSVQCYPTRILGSMVYLKPGREEANFGIVEIQSVLHKITKRYGIRSNYLYLGELFLPYYNNSNIRKFGLSYIREPTKYELVQRDVIKYVYDVDVEKTPIYNRYVEVLGSDYIEQIRERIFENIITKKVVITEIKPLKVGTKLTDRESKIIKWLFSYYHKSIVREDKNIRIYIPDYHLEALLVDILLKMRDIDKIRNYLLKVNRKLYELRMIRMRDYETNNSIISVLNDKRDAISRIRMDKISISEKNIPSIILSRVKIGFISFLHVFKKSRVITKNTGDIINRLLNKSKNVIIREILGYLLSDKSEIIAIGMSIPIAFMAD